MNLSALLTSVGINLGLCFLYFTLYSILRNQTSCVTFYAPREVGKRGSEGRVDFSWKRLLLSTVCLMKKAWETSKEDLLSASGLDVVVFMHIFVLSLKVFIFGGIIGIVFLLPVNFMGNQLNYDFFDLRNKSLDLVSISNVDDGSNRTFINLLKRRKLSKGLLNVYAPKFETGGRLWPIVHNSMIFSLILMHIIAIGIFGLKKLPLASSLTIPLPVLTFLFNEYCRKRFLPIFQEYPTEFLVKKDRADQNDPMMAEFHKKLRTAYQGPVQHSQSKDGLNSPLLP